MSIEREKMIATLKEQIVPVLRSRGFKGSFPHFRRPSNAVIHLLTFQMDKWGSCCFAVEIASCPIEGATLLFGDHIAPTKVNTHHISYKHRLRLGTSKGDHWFRYDRRSSLSSIDPYERAAQEVLPLLDSQAETYWKQPHEHTPSA
jgi:hypothetical protein